MNIRSLFLGSACAVALASPALAAPPNVAEIDSVAALNAMSATDLAALPAFHLAAYYCTTAPNCAPDGGEGLFVQFTSGCSALAADGGSVLHVLAGGSHFCFRRQNLNGDLRQYGVTVGSPFDCSPTPANGGTGSGLAGCKAITSTLATPPNPIGKMINAINANGLHTMTTSGVQVKLDTTVTIPSGVDFDLGGASPFGNRNDTSGNPISLLNIPGTVFVPHGSTVQMSEHSAVHNGILLPAWYTAPGGIDDLYDIVHTMTNDGDTGLTCGGPNPVHGSGCVIHDMEVDGFDTGIELRNAPYTFVYNNVADDNVCYFVASVGGSVKFGPSECSTRITDFRYNHDWFTITGVADDGTGLCKVTVSAVSGLFSDLRANDRVWIHGMQNNSTPTGPATLNGRFLIKSVDVPSSSLVLSGSGCVGAGLALPGSRTASWTAGATKLTNVSDLTDVQPKTLVTGTGIAGGTRVLAVWRAKNIVILDTPTTAPGSAAAITFAGDALAPGGNACTRSSGTCLFLDAAARVDAGHSAGGDAAGNRATGYMLGGVNSGDRVAGFQASQTEVFARDVGIHVDNSNEIHFFAPNGDSDGDEADPYTTFFIIDGDSNNSSMVSGTTAKDGNGIVVDFDDPTGCLTWADGGAGTNAPTSPQFEVDKGCFIAHGLRPGGGVGFVSNDASYVGTTGSQIYDTSIYYEGDDAQGVTSTLGSVTGPGQNNLINDNVQAGPMGPANALIPAPLPPIGTDLQIVQLDGQQGRVLQDVIANGASYLGRRADGTTDARTKLQDLDRIATFGGQGYVPSGYTETAGGFAVDACQNWSNTATCTADVVIATEKGTTTAAETARFESGGLGVGTGEGVAAPLEILKNATSTTSSTIASLGSGGTGAITVAAAANFPSPGILVVDGEAMAYQKTGSTALNVTARGLLGTTAATHANGATVSFFGIVDGSTTAAAPAFAATSTGDMWWNGHLLSGGVAPALGSGVGTGATVSGNDNAGRLVSGSGASASFTLTFAQPWVNAPVCLAQDETTRAKNPLVASTVSGSAVTFTAASAPTAGDKISYACVGFR